MEKFDLAISATSLFKTYTMGDVEVEVLKDIGFDVGLGEFIVICGPSGVGKTTLLCKLISIASDSNRICELIAVHEH